MRKYNSIILAFACIQGYICAFEFGAMIDAGSSGTRIYVYRWNDREAPATSNTGPFSEPFTESHWSKSVDIPLASLVGKKTEISNQMTNLFTVIDDTLSGYKLLSLKKTVPVYLGATAGLRYIAAADRDTLIADVRDVVAKSDYLYVADNIKILSGEEEALFGWISVNYLHNLATKPNPFPTSTVTVGALDLGGASTQITYVPNGDIMGQYTQYTTPSRVRHNLYAVSHLGYGSNRALEDMYEAVATGKMNGDAVDFACMNTGLEIVVEVSGDRMITFRGTSDVAACTELYTTFLAVNTPCPGVDGCSIRGTYQPLTPTDMDMYLFSGYYYSLTIFKADKRDASVSYVKGILDAQCTKSWETLQADWPDAGGYLSTACSSLNYVYTILSKAYKFPDNFNKLHFVHTVQGYSVSWAFGRILYEANEQYYKRILPSVTMDPKKQPTSGFKYAFIATAVLSAVLAVALAFLVRKQYIEPKSAGSVDQAALNESYKDINV